MLFGYPIASTGENWLHECLCDIVREIHQRLDAGTALPAWPTIIPAPHRVNLRRRKGLRNRIQAYATAAGILSVAERGRVLACLEQQNRISELVACNEDCEQIADLPPAIRQPVLELFDFAFKLLTDIGVRDRHYAAIYSAASYHVCPFCGCEYFDAPGAPREDMDHYLAKSLYPFAAANLRNLAPMGMKCNERYKLAHDILTDSAGVRRRAFDPYEDRQVLVNLDGSIPFGGVDGKVPDWRIDFVPNSDECDTWDDVLRVRERLRRDVLDASFMRWLGEFAAWFRIRVTSSAPTDSQVVNALEIYAADQDLMGLRPCEFLRAPAFRMLRTHCLAGNQRLLELLKDIVAMAVPPATAAGIP